MDKELAQHVVRVAFRSAAQLQDLLPLLKEHCNGREYKAFTMAVAKAMDGINTELTNRVFASFPKLKEEVEENINKYGRVM